MAPGRYSTLREHGHDAAAITGLAVGTALEGYDRLANGGRTVFAHLNPWELDHVVHAGYSLGLTALSDTAVEYGSPAVGDAFERAADVTEDTTVGRYLEQAADRAREPSTKRKAAAAAGTLAAFTLVKEGYIDQAADVMDATANFTPMLKYHPSVSWENVDRLYDRVRGTEPGEPVSSDD